MEQSHGNGKQTTPLAEDEGPTHRLISTVDLPSVTNTAAAAREAQQIEHARNHGLPVKIKKVAMKFRDLKAALMRLKDAEQIRLESAAKVTKP